MPRFSHGVSADCGSRLRPLRLGGQLSVLPGRLRPGGSGCAPRRRDSRPVPAGTDVATCLGTGSGGVPRQRSARRCGPDPLSDLGARGDLWRRATRGADARISHGRSARPHAVCVQGRRADSARRRDGNRNGGRVGRCSPDRCCQPCVLDRSSRPCATPKVMMTAAKNRSK